LFFAPFLYFPLNTKGDRTKKKSKNEMKLEARLFLSNDWRYKTRKRKGGWIVMYFVRERNGAEQGMHHAGPELPSAHQLGGTPAHRRGDGVPSPNPPGPALLTTN
jgi:hypothetical protein